MNNKELKIGNIVSFIIACSFSMTVLYVYGYCSALEHSKNIHPNLMKYFNVNDYFSISIVFLSWAFIIGVGIVLGNKFANRLICQFDRESPKEYFSMDQKFVKLITIGSIILATLYTVASFFINVPKSYIYVIWGFSGCFLWLYFFNWYKKEKRLAEDWINRFHIFVKFFPIIVISSFCCGLYEGTDCISKFDRLHNSRLFLQDEPDFLDGKVLFALEKYLIFMKYPSTDFQIIPISRIKLINEYGPFKK